MQKIAVILAGAGLAAGFSSLASAAEYCVTCEGPPGLYRCVIDGTPEGPGQQPGASLHCISQMAKQGRHERCAVSRGSPFPCPGLTAVVQPPARSASPPPPAEHAAPYPEPQPPAAAPMETDAETVTATPAPEETTAAPAPASQVPRTVEELAGQTVRSSKEGLEKAGKAIGGTAKKAGEVVGQTGTAIGQAASNTWTCISSFFTSCGGEPEADPQAVPPDEQPPTE